MGGEWVKEYGRSRLEKASKMKAFTEWSLASHMTSKSCRLPTFPDELGQALSLMEA